MDNQLNQNLNTADLNGIHEYSELLSDILKFRARGEVPMALVRTYGCQQNVADSEKLKGMLKEMGCDFTEDENEADIIIFNTCAIREHAEDRVFGNVGALKNIKRRHPSLIIALCGCMMEQEHIAERIYKSFSFVSLVFGTHEIHNFPKLLYSTITENHRIVARGNDDGIIHENIPTLRDGTFKGWLSIMYGCNNFCTYCIVPYVRGRERSRSIDNIVAEIEAAVKDGYKEFTLLGQNVNSYGKDFGDKDAFAKLLRRVDIIPGVERIHYMTSHPRDMSEEVIKAVAECEHICENFHLPFQAGSSEILRRMNRGYTKEKYLELVKMVRKYVPDATITTDIIVGFPGETEEDFEETLDVVRQVGFTSAYTFIYSKRSGTPAAKMENQVPLAVKKERLNRLMALQNENSLKCHEKLVGQTVEVLAEGPSKQKTVWNGRTRTGVLVLWPIEDKQYEVGQKVNVQIEAAQTWLVKGKAVD